jgi:hypothetical protein
MNSLKGTSKLSPFRLSTADIGQRSPYVSFVPGADSCTATNSPSFNELVGAKEERLRNRQPESLSGP